MLSCCVTIRNYKSFEYLNFVVKKDECGVWCTRWLKHIAQPPIITFFHCSYGLRSYCKRRGLNANNAKENFFSIFYVYYIYHVWKMRRHVDIDHKTRVKQITKLIVMMYVYTSINQSFINIQFKESKRKHHDSCFIFRIAYFLIKWNITYHVNYKD